MAPEIIGRREYLGTKADIWALGVILYALLTGMFPFKGCTTNELYLSIGKGKFHPPNHVSSRARALIARMLNVNPMSRPSADEILEDPWFNGEELQLSKTMNL